MDCAFGYVTLIKQTDAQAHKEGERQGEGEGEEESQRTQSVENNNGWTVVDVVYGVPIFDAALNRAVCHRIRAHHLLSGEFMYCDWEGRERERVSE